MLTIKGTKASSFFKRPWKNEDIEVTQYRQAVNAKNKITRKLAEPEDESWLNSPLSEQAASRVEPSALDQLRALVDKAVERTKNQHKQVEKVEEDDSRTRYMPIVQNSVFKRETYYRNHTAAPYLLVIGAILENRRYRHWEALPSMIYVPEGFHERLAKDMKFTAGKDFNGYSFPFHLANGKTVDIPIISAKRAHGIDLALDTVVCYN